MRGRSTALKEAEPRELCGYVWDYLKPHGKPAPRAHLFTINGLTYPFHRDLCFAAVPDPHEIKNEGGKLSFSVQRSKRRYSMLAYLYSVRPGDLLFFFQADPQCPSDIWNRRGFRGIWLVNSTPFRDTTEMKHPQTGYKILGCCPKCGSPFNFGTVDKGGKKCPLCGNPYPTIRLCGREYSTVVLSARVLIKPLLVFKKTAGDNRVYSDMSVEPLIWISRADNAMGPGKGSSIRVFLPEEATKISFMLATEDGQQLEDHPERLDYPGQVGEPIRDYNGEPATFLRAVMIGGRIVLEHELHLNLYFAMNIDNPGSPIHRVLRIPLDRVDYWTTELPWGYTGDTADFVLSLWDRNKGRYCIYLFEFKKDEINKDAIAETMLYTPWVAQILTQFRHETTEVTVQPVIVGESTRLKNVPERYQLKLELFSSSTPKSLSVEPPIVMTYRVTKCRPQKDRVRGGTVYYVEGLDFSKVQLSTKSVSPPPPTLGSTTVEREYVKRKYLATL